MLSIPKNPFYVIQRCGNLHKLAIWKPIFTAREVNGIQRSEALHALRSNWRRRRSWKENQEEKLEIQINLYFFIPSGQPLDYFHFFLKCTLVLVPDTYFDILHKCPTKYCSHLSQPSHSRHHIVVVGRRISVVGRSFCCGGRRRGVVCWSTPTL